MAERFLIRVYGDSLSLPRVSERVAYYQTYPEMLAAAWRQSLPDAEVHLYNRSFSGASAKLRVIVRRTVSRVPTSTAPS